MKFRFDLCKTTYFRNSYCFPGFAELFRQLIAEASFRAAGGFDPPPQGKRKKEKRKRKKRKKDKKEKKKEGNYE